MKILRIYNYQLKGKNLQVKYQQRKCKKILKFIKNIRKVITEIPRKDQKMWKVEKFFLQVKQGPYYPCTICHRSWYQCSIRLFKHEKFYILISKLYHVVTLVNGKFYTCETCHEYIYKIDIRRKAVDISMALYPTLNKPNGFKKFEKPLISKTV